MKESVSYSALATVEMNIHHKLWRVYERYVDQFISPSQFLIDLCVKHGWKRNKFVHIPNPLEKDTIEEKFQEGECVSYIGRLSEEKGVHHILDVAKKTPHIPYRIVGDGPERNKLVQRIETEHIKNVVCIGFVTGDALVTEQERARLFVLPAIWYENNPLSVLEACARGKITIATNIGGLPEMLDTDLLVEPNNIHDLAEKIQIWYSASSSNRQKKGYVLQERVRQTNDSTRHLQQMVDIYTKM